MTTLKNVPSLPDSIERMLLSLRDGKAQRAVPAIFDESYLVKGGKVVDPANNILDDQDVLVVKGWVVEVANSIKPEKGVKVIDARNLLVIPGLIDMHLHLGDLFELGLKPFEEAVTDGVTLGISPGASNTFPSIGVLAAEFDRGLPMNGSCLTGAGSLIATNATTEQLVRYFQGNMEQEEFFTCIGRNPFIYHVANLVIGIKEHLAHLFLCEEGVERAYAVTDQAKLLFMSHCQDPQYAEKVAARANGRKLHLGHTNAAGAGTHDDGLESLNRVLELVKQPHITGEFVSSLLRPNGGCRDGLSISDPVRKRCYEALNNGEIRIIISDGQAASSFKGFGDSRDNVPCLLELEQEGVLSLSEAVRTMTCNVTDLLAQATGRDWWKKELGHLGVGARANITIIDPKVKRTIYTFINGTLAAFESRLVRNVFGAGGLVTKYGIHQKTGYGEFNLFSYHQ